MAKHVSKETKYYYVMRYLNGESSTRLGQEINEFVKSPDKIILMRSRKYETNFIKGFERSPGTGKIKPKKKPKPNY